MLTPLCERIGKCTQEEIQRLMGINANSRFNIGDHHPNNFGWYNNHWVVFDGGAINSPQ